MAGVEKICVICGQDCSARPRVKSPEGKYACRACLEQREARQAPAEAAALGNDDFGLDAIGQGDGLDLDGLLGDVAVPESNPCPACGRPRAAGAVMCMSCGHNSQTGQSVTTSIKKESRAGAIAGVAASQAGGVIAAPVLWILGGAVAAAVGAGVWAAIAYFTGYELGIVAWGIGFLVGAGVIIGARGEGNVASGTVAMAIAILAIAGGKYFAARMLLENIASQSFFAEAEMTSDDVLQYIVDERAYQRIESGREIAWPDPAMTVEEAIWPDDYPEDLQREARAEYDALSAEDLVEYETRARAYFGEGIALNADAIISENFWHLWSIWDALWVILAISTAYKIGAAEAGD